MYTCNKIYSILFNILNYLIYKNHRYIFIKNGWVSKIWNLYLNVFTINTYINIF